MSLYVAAFGLLLVAGALVMLGSLGKLDAEALRLLRISMWVSGAAIATAVAGVLLPRRR